MKPPLTQALKRITGINLVQALPERISQWKYDHPVLSWLVFVMASLALLAGLAWYLYMQAQHLLHPEPIPPLQSLNIQLLVPLLLLTIALLVLRPSRTSTTHGSAHWATLSELKKANLTGHKAAKGQSGHAPESLLLVGYRGSLPIQLTERQQESHVLIVAPTGKRKSSGFFIPALLAERGHRSLLINDVKDELYRFCGGTVSLYHDVLLFSPTNPAWSSGYNPLAHIKTSKDARDFARAWVENTGLSREQFYNTASMTLIAALVLYLVDTEQDPPLSRLADLLSTNTLISIKGLLLDEKKTSARAKNTAAAFLETIEGNPKLSIGVMLGVTNRFSILIDSQDYRAVTAHNEIDFARMVEGERPVALFLNVPASVTEDIKPLTSVLIMQMMNYLTKRAEQEPSGRLPRPFCFYLDEFANAGRIPDIEKHITLVRGAGMAVISALQDFGQAERIYGPEITGTLRSNFTTQIVLPGLGQAEAEYYSKRLGKTTVLSKSTSVMVSDNNRSSGTTSKSEASRALMEPDEIRTMPVGAFLMTTDNAPPVRGVFRTYIERPELTPLLKLPVRRTRRRRSKVTAASETSSTERL